MCSLGGAVMLGDCMGKGWDGGGIRAGLGLGYSRRLGWLGWLGWGRDICYAGWTGLGKGVADGCQPWRGVSTYVGMGRAGNSQFKSWVSGNKGFPFVVPGLAWPCPALRCLAATHRRCEEDGRAPLVLINLYPRAFIASPVGCRIHIDKRHCRIYYPLGSPPTD